MFFVLFNGVSMLRIGDVLKVVVVVVVVVVAAVPKMHDSHSNTLLWFEISSQMVCDTSICF